MNLYRCKFILLEFNNLESNMFIRGLDEESVKEKSLNIFKKTLEQHLIPDAKYIQTVTLSSEKEVKDYQLMMKSRNNSNKNLN